MAVSCDYLVKGAGAMAMAFADVMIHESDATLAIVDRRPAPGGHWNDAYPFVRLHQPAAYYGVPSRELGRGRKDTAGTNAGMYELATGVGIADYFHEVMRDTLLPSGRVQYFPMSELTDDGEIVSLLSGERQTVEVGKRLVDATFIDTRIPLTHTRKFAVEDGVACIPPNDIVRVAPAYKAYVVLGAGKTAIDAICWLLTNGAPASAIQWVLPRDPWLINRLTTQPGLEHFDDTFGAFAEHYSLWARAESLDDICAAMNEMGSWFRLDDDVQPAMFHAATVSLAEFDLIRGVKGMIRKGRVQRIEDGRLVLEGGDVDTPPGALHVDCTAGGIAGNVGVRKPVFEPGRINLQMVRQYAPTFSSALIAHLEVTMEDDAAKNALTLPTPMTDTVEDWLVMAIDSFRNQYAWGRDRDLSAWIATCRLDQFGPTMMQIDPTDEAKMAVRQRIRGSIGPAVENLTRLAGALRTN